MEGKVGEALRLCVELYKSYRPQQQTPDAHADCFFSTNTTVAADLRAFASEVFFGLLRYKKMLTKTIVGLFERYKTARSGDFELYMALTYLAVFRLDELHWTEFRRIVVAQDAYKMFLLLEFLFSDAQRARRDGWLRACWSTIFDFTFVEKQLLGALDRHAPAAQALMAELRGSFARDNSDSSAQPSRAHSRAPSDSKTAVALSDTTTAAAATALSPSDTHTQAVSPSPGGSASPAAAASPGSGTARGEATGRSVGGAKRSPVKKLTVVKPFALGTLQRTRVAVEERERRKKAQEEAEVEAAHQAQLERSAHIGQIPAAISSTSLSDIQRSNERRRQEVMNLTRAKYDGSGGFESNTFHRPSRLERTNQQLAAEQEAEYQQCRANPIPELPPSPEVKQTAASLLRENALYRRQQDQQAAAIRQYEMDLKDSSDFDRWRHEREEQEEVEMKAITEARKRAMAQASALASQAVEHKAEENRAAVAKMREQRAELEQEKNRLQQIDLEKRQKLRQDVDSTRHNASEAVAKVKEQRKEIVQSVQEAQAERSAQVEKEKEVEKAARRKLIQQIQAMEKIAAVRSRQIKVIDRTATSGLGLSIEMSMAELQARLDLMHMHERVAVEEKRKQIVKEKHNKQRALQAMARTHIRIRQQKREEGTRERSQRRDSAQRIREEADEKNRVIGELIEQKRSERQTARLETALRLADEARRHKMEAHLLVVRKRRTEEKHLEDLMRGVERDDREREKREREQKLQQALLLEREAQQRVKLQRTVVRAKKAERKAALSELDQARREAAELSEEEAHTKRLQATTIRARIERANERTNTQISRSFGLAMSERFKETVRGGSPGSSPSPAARRRRGVQ